MQINSITSRSGPTFQEPENFAKIKQAFQDLGKALESGNLTDAKTALATLQKNAPPKTEAGSDPMSVKMEALTKALNSGDVKAAKDAYADIKKAMSQRPSGSKRPQGGGGKPSGSAPPQSAHAASSSQSSSKSDKVYDKRDTNKDGEVSWTEQTSYDLAHPDQAKQRPSYTIDTEQGVLDATA